MSPVPLTGSPPMPQTLFAANLGIQYVTLPYNDGSIGVKLVRRPPPNSPAGQLQLDTNDVIYMLDGQPIFSPEDLRSHVGQTVIDYVDASTGAKQSGTIDLPPNS